MQVSQIECSGPAYGLELRKVGRGKGTFGVNLGRRRRYGAWGRHKPMLHPAQIFSNFAPMLAPPTDEHFMKLALVEAQRAYDAKEVPVGAVVTCQGQVIARGYNLTERLHDFTAHAEMQAYTAASEFLGGKYLDQCTLYVTLEPCLMCAGGAFNTRVGRIVFGAYDHKRGFTKYHAEEGAPPVVHPKTEVKGGVMEEACATLLKEFFASRRKR